MPSPLRTFMTASAVEGAVTRSARGSRSRRKRAHWALAWGCDTTRVIRSSGISPAATRQWWIGCTTSPAIRTRSASPASASSVAATPPSSAFSIGTTARSTSPSWTAITVSQTDAQGTSSTPGGADARSASSL